MSGRHRRPDEGARDGLLANVADPAVIELRYDASLFTGPGTPPADPAVLEVEHAEGPNATYFGIPNCLGRGAMPLGATSCLDRSASRTEDGGVVMVVRTTTPAGGSSTERVAASLEAAQRGEPAPEQGAVLLDERLQASGSRRRAGRR